MNNSNARGERIVKTTAVILACAGSLVLNSVVRANITEGFDTVTPAGWSMVNQSSLPGNNWHQGTTALYTAQAGTLPNSYAEANFQSTLSTVPATIDNWMITPLLTGIQDGDTISFYTRKSPLGNPYPDRLELRLSTNGGLNPGGVTGGVGDFTTLLLSVDPTLTVGGYPLTWTQYSVTLSGLGGPVNGAIAFRYFVTNGGINGLNSDDIGVDTFAYTQVPAPATASLVLLGGLGAMRRRRS